MDVSCYAHRSQSLASPTASMTTVNKTTFEQARRLVPRLRSSSSLRCEHRCGMPHAGACGRFTRSLRSLVPLMPPLLTSCHRRAEPLRHADCFAIEQSLAGARSFMPPLSLLLAVPTNARSPQNFAVNSLVSLDYIVLYATRSNESSAFLF